MEELPHFFRNWVEVAGLAGLAAGSFVIALSGALMPGPLLVAAVREGARQGHRAGPLLTLGHGVLEAAVVVLVYLGLGQFLKRDGPFAAVALVGGGMLLAMGLLMLRSARKARAASLTQARDKGAPGRRRLAAAGAIISGAAVSLANPYWSVWWVTAGLFCITFAATLGWAGLAVFFLGHITADLAWYWLVTWAVSRGRRLLTDRSYRALIAVCGVFLIGFAGYFIYRGAGRLKQIRREAAAAGKKPLRARPS